MKIKKSDEQLVRSFWESHPEALFSPRVIALVLNVSESWLEKHRAAGRGPKFSKMLNTIIFYRKRDIESFMKECEK